MALGVKNEVTFEECMQNVQTYIKRPENLDLIRRAYAFAHEHHAGQFRKSGAPYEVHVIQVANTLALLHSGPKTIAAGLLHDTVEDCEGVDHDTIVESFGEEIAMLVDAVTKIKAIKFKDEKEYLASNHRKLFIALAKDVRVILIKLADRLHNMRTLEYMKPEKQKKSPRKHWRCTRRSRTGSVFPRSKTNWRICPSSICSRKNTSKSSSLCGSGKATATSRCKI